MRGGDGREEGRVSRSRGLGARVLRAIPFQQLKILIGEPMASLSTVLYSCSFCGRALSLRLFPCVSLFGLTGLELQTLHPLNTVFNDLSPMSTPRAFFLFHLRRYTHHDSRAISSGSIVAFVHFIPTSMNGSCVADPDTGESSHVDKCIGSSFARLNVLDPASLIDMSRMSKGLKHVDYRTSLVNK